jgi:chromosome segregation ATPase
VLETQKNDAVLFTFRQSSENFSRIFKKLVPTGHAQLTMKTSENESVPIQDVSNYEMRQKQTSSKCSTIISIYY